MIEESQNLICRTGLLSAKQITLCIVTQANEEPEQARDGTNLVDGVAEGHPARLVHQQSQEVRPGTEKNEKNIRRYFYELEALSCSTGLPLARTSWALTTFPKPALLINLSHMK